MKIYNLTVELFNKGAIKVCIGGQYLPKNSLMQNPYAQMNKYLRLGFSALFEVREELNTIFLLSTTLFTIRNLLSKKTKPIWYGPLYPK